MTASKIEWFIIYLAWFSAACFAGLTHRVLRKAACSVHGRPTGWRAESDLHLRLLQVQVSGFHELRAEPAEPKRNCHIVPERSEWRAAGV